eukprot:scaffold68366_cov45-Prasinocladus_malaysianus.AAC.2
MRRSALTPLRPPYRVSQDPIGSAHTTAVSNAECRQSLSRIVIRISSSDKKTALSACVRIGIDDSGCRQRTRC